MKRIYTLSITFSTPLVRKFLLLLSVSLITWVSQAQPGTQVSAITFEPVPTNTTSFKFNWSIGNGAGRIVVIKNATGVFKPVNGTNTNTFGASSDFNVAADLDGGSGVAKVVAIFTNTEATVTVTNLTPNTPYYIQVYEFATSASNPTYSFVTSATNPRGFTYFTTSGTFNVPIDVANVRVQALGGGGGGGGADGNTGESRAGGGGAGGTYTQVNSYGVTGGAALSVVVGAGGTAGAGGDAATNGGAGGASSFNGANSAVGGGGGILGNSTNETGAGAGTATGTTFNGGAGAEAPPTGGDGNNATASGAGGGGAGTTGSGGAASGSTAGTAGANGGGIGASGITGLSNPAFSLGNNATQLGGGGSGGWDNFADVSPANGGTGAPGYVIVSFNDNTAPVVSSINRLTPATSPATGTSVTFRVTFNENVSNVDATDFAVTGPGSPIIGTVTANSGVQYDVQITGISGSGTVDLNFGSHNIVDISNNAFAGSITSEQTYSMDNTGPVLSLAVLQSPTTGTAKINDVITFRVTADASGFVIGTSTINSQTFSGIFTDNGDNTYDLTYTVTNGHANWTAGALPFSIRLNDALGNSSNAIIAYTTANTLAGDANAPSFTSVTPSPSTGTAKINDNIQINFTAGGAEATLVAGAALTVNGVNVAGSFANLTGGNYRVTYAVASGNTDRAAGALPLSLQINDVAGNTTTINAFTAANTLAIDANAPVISSVTSNATGAGALKIGQTITFTADIATTEAGLTLAPTTYNGGTLTWSTANSGDTYTATYTVIAGQTDQTSPLQLTGVTATDAATNTSAPVNGTDVAKTIDANAPTISNVTIPDVAMKVNDVVIATITVGDDGGQTYTLSPSTIGGFTLSNFTRLGNTSYSAQFTVTNLGTDLLAGDNIPTNIIIADPATNPSVAYTADIIQANDPIDANRPTIVISAPSATIAKNSNSRTYTVTYAGENSISLVAGNITLNTTLGANADVAVGIVGSVATVTLTNFTGNGTVGISIIAGTASDAAGNTALAAGPSATITVDNLQPAIVLSSTDADGYVRSGQANVTITATFTEANGLNGTPTISIPTASTPVVTANMTGGPLVWTYSWDTPTGDQGPITVSISATDNAGNASATPTGQTAFTIDNTAPSAVTINQAGSQTEQDYINPVNYTVVFTDGPIDATTFTSADFVLAGGTTTYSIGTITTSNNITWNVEVNVSAVDGGGAGTVIPALTATVTDLAGNVSGALASSTSDATVEYIIEPTSNGTISVTTGPTQNTLSISRSGGDGERILLVAREGSAVNFVPVDGVDYDGSDITGQDFFTSTVLDGNGNKLIEDTGGGGPYNITGLSGSTTYHFAVFHYNQGTQSSYNNFRTTSPATTNSTTTACGTLPTAPTAGVHVPNTTGITFNWNRSNGTDESLILLRVNDGSAITAPVNGANFTAVDDPNFSNAPTYGNAKVVWSNENGGSATAQSKAITNLGVGVTYAYAIYLYNPTTFCYQTTHLSGTFTTTTSTDAELTVTAGALSEPVTISSMGTALTGAIGPQTNSVANFDFTVTDADGDNGVTTNADADGANGLISQIIIYQGPDNQISDWTQAIASAQLSDGTVTQTANITINPTNITIASITNGTGQLGEVLDDGTKTYTLTIALKTALGGSLPTTIDNLQFDFNVTTTATSSFTVSGSGSSFPTGQSVNSGISKNKVNVTASKIAVASQPSIAATADIALVSQPIFHAQDFNNNHDLDINNALTVTTTNPTNLGHSSALANFSNGVADFVGSGFKFANVGTSTMAVSITSPNITSANTSGITVSATTNLFSATSIQPGFDLFNNDINKSVLAFRLQTTGSNVNLNTVTFTSSLVPTTNYLLNFRLYTNSSDDFSSASLVAGPQASLTFSGLNIPYSSTPTYFFLAVDVEGGFPTAFPTVQFSVANTSLTVSKGTVNAASFFGTNYNLVDNQAPFIQDINTIASFLNSWGGSLFTSTPEYNGGQVSFIVTFNEPVQNVFNNKFTTFIGGSAGPDFPAISYNNNPPTPVDVNGNPTSSPSRYWKKTYDINQGTGFIYQAFSNASSGVTDIVGNQETTVSNFDGSPGDYSYYLTLPKPTNDPIFQVPSGNTTSVTLSWNHNHGTERATDYYIRAKESTLAYTGASMPINGTKPIDPNGSADGVIYVHVPSNAFGSGPAIQTTSITGLKSGVSYDFEIYPYAQSDNTNFNNGIEYKLDNPGQISFTTAIASASIMETFSTTTSISTLIDENPVQSQGVFSFRIREDADGTNDDNAPFKFSAITINQGTGNDIANWTHVIAGAALADGTANPDITGTVGATTIAFTGLSSTTSGNFGYIDDNATKTYTLKIWLKDSLLNNYASIIDGLNLAFSATLINANYDDSNNQLTSRLGTTNTAQSGGTNNAIAVSATKLKFRTPAGASVISTYPQSAIGVGTPFSANIAGQDPLVYALDAHNNLDLSYTAVNGNTGTISNSGGLGQSTNTINFVNGILSLNPFYFTTAGVNTQFTITGNGSPTVTPVTSSQVTAVITNTTTISAATAAASELASFTSLTTALPASHNFDFTVTDDAVANATTFADNDGLPTLIQTVTITQDVNNGTNGGGDAATFDNWTLSIAGAQLSDGISTVTIANPSANITGSTLVFNVAGTSLETITDGGNKTYQLRIWLLNPVDATLRDILDNKDFAFTINQSNLSLGAANTTSTVANSNTNTADGRNVVTVTATQLDFFTQWTALAIQNYDAALSPNPTAKARDANQNLDTDYNTAATVTAFDSNLIDAKTYPLVNSTVTVNNGLITFNAGLQVSSSGNGLHNDVSRLVLTSGALTTGNSNSFTLNYSGSSDIVRDGTFTHPTDIQFINNREAVNLTAANGVALDRFLLRDGGASNDTDGTKTKLQSITLNLTNYANIRRIGIYDETGTEIQERDFTGFSAGGDIVFNSFATLFEANDNDRTTKTLTVRVSFKDLVTDNQQINVSVISATAGGVSSQLTAINIAGDNLSTDKNKIEVVATQIDFTTVPTGASISVPLSPQVIVSARDVLTNLDSDYNGTITATDNNNNANFHTLNDPTGAFSGGTKTYPAGFQFDIGNGNVQLTINSGAGSGANNVNAGAIFGISPVISVISSFESKLASPTGYNLPDLIPYVNHQSADLSVTDDGFELVQLVVADGTADGTTDGDTPGVPGDLDGASTVLNSLKLGITNYTAIRSIAAYNDAGVRIVNGVIAPVAGIQGEVTFDFTGNEIIATDDAEKLFKIKATFQSSPTLVSDTMHIRLSFRSAVLGTGSKFYDVPAGSGTYIVGNPPGNVTAPKLKNEIEVTATSLDFVTQASTYAGVNEPIGASYTTSPMPGTTSAVIHARDKFQVVDLDFNYAPSSISGTTTGSITSSDSFINGVLDLDGMTYSNVGNGTISVVANGINSSNPPGANVNAIPGQLVNVVNVLADINTNGVLTTTNIKGGTPSVVIFGVTFTPEYASTTEPSLKGFTFRFNVPYKTASATIFKNWLVTESQTGTYSGSTDVTISGATVTEAASPAAGPGEFDMIVVDWGANPPRELFDDQNVGNIAPRTYYLVTDADITANISTPSITPFLIDQGYGTSTDNNIITTAGTAIAKFDPSLGANVVLGQAYSFASTRPPVLLSAKGNLTSPYNGQLNVNPGITQIALEFDVEVWSFDGAAELFDRTNNTKIANLTVPNQGTPGSGWYSDGGTINPILFNISLLPGKSLKPDSVYYVTIKNGSFDNGTNSGTGISDNGFNFYGGIQYNGGLYFKISSPNPPVLSSALAGSPNTFINKTMGSFSVRFDQGGTGYYMVIDRAQYLTFNGGLGNAPDTAAIRTPASYIAANPNSVVSTGSFPITQINTPQFVSFVPNVAPYIVNQLTPSSVYDVWVFAKNDALPIRIGTHYPYGDAASSYDFVTFVKKPTVQFTVPTLPKNINQPTFLLCPDSYVTLTNPIVISEATSGEFQNGALQDFYILLPPGFQFDGVTKPTVLLNGTDFNQASLSVVFVNNTIVRVSYINNNNLSLDNLIITDLKLLGVAGSVPGDIRRFAGNAILPAIPASNKLATVSLNSVTPLKFTNSYSQDNDFSPYLFFNTGSVITAIPDNYVDKDPGLDQSIRLVPQITPANDFGASFFTGSGVTNDVLNLGAVPLNAAFDITMTHADMNGCVIETDVQHVVYDHNSPISIKLGIGISPLGTNQTLKNPNFQTNSTLPPNYVTPPVFAPDNATLPKILHNELAGYELLELFADSISDPSNQIMRGADWQALIEQIPVWVKRTTSASAPLRNSVPGTNYVQDYQWDYSHILNAVMESKLLNPSTKITTDPYDNFKSLFPTAQGNFYWKGGSLGKIRFTGVFQNQADLQVIVPFRQEVELFVPPIPIIEASNHSFNFDPNGLRSTAIYCQNQVNVVQLNGFPFAVPGVSTGYFTLRDSANTSIIIYDTKDPNITDTPNANFTDAGNGTASFVAGTITNNHRTIRVDYTYQDVGAPESGTATFYIRITPNPVADFSAISQLAKRDPVNLGRPIGSTSYCEDNWITFSNTSTFSTAVDPNKNSRTYLANTSALWDLGELSSSTSQNIDTVSHIYDVFGKYDVKFSVNSQFNCPSQQITKAVFVGAIPSPAFSMNGISTTTLLNVVDNSTVPSGNGSSSAILPAKWYFGVPSVASPDPLTTTFTSTGNYSYSTPGHYTITLLAQSQITTSALPGCEITYQRPVIIVPSLSAATIGAESLDDFESSDPLKQWQESSTNNLVSSWERGDATESSLVDLVSNVWATGLNSSYNAGEVSFLYSPSYDMSNLVRPKVSFDHVAYMGVNDGVVIEFSTDTFNIADPQKKWFRVGTDSDGNNWYNKSGLASKPGTQKNVINGIVSGDYGWSSPAVPLDTVLHSQHTISPDVPAGKRSHVIFRFALASLSGSSNQGFAFDNFRVGERTRVVLIENFTNVGNANSINGFNIEKRESDFLKGGNFTGIGTDVIKINYHVGFPNLDPLNDDFPVDPSARALYYNINETPLARMDGGKDPLRKYFSAWGTDMYNIRTLKLAQAQLQISPPVTSSNGGYEFSVTVTANTKLSIDTTILHIAFVEASIPITGLNAADQSIVATGETSFEYVLKKMVPSALGTRLNTTLLKGQSKTFGPFEWNPDLGKLYNSPNDLAIIAFLQNEVTKEVYQAEIRTSLTDPVLVTDVEDPDYAQKIHLFPNPANNEVNIQLPAAVVKSTPVEMFDTYGKSVYQSSFKAGEQIKTISTSELTSGVYFIQLIAPDGKIARRKVMVIHR